jgi:NADH-quinone oxidoreductase subunit C
MTTNEIHDLLVSQFGSEKIVAINTEAIDPWIEVAPAAIHEVAQFLKSDERLILHHLNNLTAVDYFQPDPKRAAKFGHDPHLELVYHLSSYDLRHSLVVKVKLPRWQNDVEGDIPEIDSVADVWAISDWHEREAYDLMGIKFGGHPNLRRILCPEDWVGYPLRKDYEFPLEYHGIRGK